MPPLLQIKNLSVDFPSSGSDIPALSNFSMTLNKGEMLAVVGESGSGKSVMSLALMNLLSPSARVLQGSVLFSSEGKAVVELLGKTEKELRNIRGNDMAMIFQEPMTSLNPLMTCGRQLTEPLIQHQKMTAKQAKARAISLLEKVRLPDVARVFRKYPHELSGGQRQRVMIAMAICCGPSLLICDEPTTALDVRVQRTILDLLKDLQRSENMGMIFITHDLGLVSDMADRVLVMLRGRIVEEGLVSQVFTNPQHAYTRGLLLCRPGLHKKGERLPMVSDFMEGVHQSLDINPPPSLEAQHPSTKSTEPILKVRGLHLRYSSGRNWMGRERQWIDAIRDIDFDVFKGETLGIVGESGSGKTTLGRSLLGLNKPVKGTVEFDGRDLLSMSPTDLREFRQHIQIVFQDPYSSLNPRLMIGQAIEEPLKVHGHMKPEVRRSAVMSLIEKVDLRKEHFNRYPHAFSGGQRQRIVIARALALSPDFIVFDESVSALDVSVQAQILNLINDLKARLGFTVIFISHDLSVIRYLCDRVLVMEKGKIIESGEVEAVYGSPQTEYARSLISAIPGQDIILKNRSGLI